MGADALEQLGAMGELPTWHRAIRLRALTILREHGLEAWASQRDALDAADRRLVADLFLDATLFADDAASLLRTLWPALIADDGGLLKRLLRRFLHVATVPDPRGALIFSGAPELEAQWAAQARVPLWPLWLPVLDVLRAHSEAAIAAAPAQVAAVADLWLRHAGLSWPMRDAAEDLALAIGRYVVERLQAGGSFEDKLEAALWRSTIAAGAVSPGAVLEFLAPLLDATPRPDDETSE